MLGLGVYQNRAKPKNGPKTGKYMENGSALGQVQYSLVLKKEKTDHSFLGSVSKGTKLKS